MGPPHYDISKLEIRPGREAVRKQPHMFLGPLESDASHCLIWCAIHGLVWHYRRLEQGLDRIEIRLASEGSVVVTSYLQKVGPAGVGGGLHLLQVELRELGVGGSIGLGVLNALSARLCVEVRSTPDQCHCLTFEQGLLCEEAACADAADSGIDIRLTIWPDFTILERQPFDRTRTLQYVGVIMDEDPSVTINVLDPSSTSSDPQT